MIPVPLLAAALAGPPDAGAAIQASPVCVQGAQPGRAYQAGQVYVQDAGSGPETFLMGTFPAGQDLHPRQGSGVVRLPGGRVLHLYQAGPPHLPAGELPLPASWVSFSPASLDLQPGGYGRTAVTVTIPRGTARGVYVTYLEARTAGPAAGTGMTVQAGAGAATLLVTGAGRAAACPPPSAPASPARDIRYEAAVQPSSARNHAVMTAVLEIAGITVLLMAARAVIRWLVKR